MKIVIESIPHHEHRYPTLGDYWQDEDGTFQVRVSEMPDHRMELLIALHELVEYFLCLERGIPEPAIKAFDEANLDLDDPGMDPRAPYHNEHVYATSVEMSMACALGVEWGAYVDACERRP